MPAVSESQRRFLFATKGPAWAKRHHFDNKGKLPAHAPRYSKGLAAKLVSGAKKRIAEDAAAKAKK